MTTSSKIVITSVEETKPVKSIKVANSAGYLDNIINVNKNGKAIRIANRLGTERVMVTLDSVDALIEALQIVKTRGVKLAVEEVKYDTAA